MDIVYYNGKQRQEVKQPGHRPGCWHRRWRISLVYQYLCPWYFILSTYFMKRQRDQVNPQQPSLAHLETRSWEFNLSLPRGRQESSHLGQHLLPSSMCISRRLYQKDSQDLNPCILIRAGGICCVKCSTLNLSFDLLSKNFFEVPCYHEAF